MKKRPYFNLSADELENVFNENLNDLTVHQNLLDELKFRSTAKASRLQDRIQAHTSQRSTKAAARPSAKAGSIQIEPSKSPKLEAQNPATARLTIPLPKYTPGPKPPITNETDNILRAWMALEVLSPQGYNREADLVGGQSSRIADISKAKLPWEMGEKSRPKKRLYYELILGTINLGPAVEALLKLYSDSRPDAPRVTRRSAIASIVLDKEGRPLDEETSFAISSFAWGVPIAMQGDLKLLAEWPSEEQSLIKSFRENLFTRDKNGELLPLTKRSISDLYSGLVSALNLNGHDISPPHFAIRQYTFYASKIPPEPSLLNSFFLSDLAKAHELAQSSMLPRALKYYLGEAKPAKKTDLLNDHSGLRDVLQPKLTPLGKWPGPGRFPLAMLQQAAVNTTAPALNETGINSVNGPPGTGKTTLLRDIVAAQIVDRASVMIEYARPEISFSATTQSVQRSGAQVVLHRLDERLKGFEMVWTCNGLVPVA